MTPLVLDVETTIFQTGNVYSQRNFLCYVGVKTPSKITTRNILLDPIKNFPSLNHFLIVGFNLKFDLNWLRRQYNIDYTNYTVWDVQLAYFILTGQRHPMPSLNDVAKHYGLETKLDNITENYWDKGIDTPDIPVEEMYEYLAQDLEVTYQCYLKQVEEFSKSENRRLFTTFKVQCEDLLVLAEIEWNGQKFNVEKSLIKEKECIEQLEDIQKQLEPFTRGYPINLDSPDQLSSLLYGGVIKHVDRVPIGVYKTGEKEGQVRYKLVPYEYEYEGYFKPVRGTELAKPGKFSSAEPVLRKLKTTRESRELIALLLERTAIEKLRSSFFGKIPNLISDMDWADDYVHGSFNQCVAVTGRLSSSKPNQQQWAELAKQLLITRYAS